MKPVYREPFYQHLMAIAAEESEKQKSVLSIDYKRQSILERTNSLLQNFDINFDKVASIIAAWALIISMITCYTTLQFTPLLLFSFLLIVVFMGAVQIKSSFDQSQVNEFSMENPLDKNYEIVQSNLYIIRSKYAWIRGMVGMVFFISAFCGLTIVSSQNYYLIGSAFVVSAMVGYFMFRNTLFEVRTLNKKFQQDYHLLQAPAEKNN